MEFTELLPIIIILILLLIGVVAVVGIVILMKRSSLKKDEKDKVNIDLQKRIETLERKIEEINKK